ncbi:MULTISPECIES: bacteriocin secretion accessory protein [Streptococcus]|uniref:bacteriocin secretion accessory protein n=1 Tax=Streptococcus TaxID=1301 RepID=UPI00025B18F5|nr:MULTISPECIES: bacteriocin secretion accessory protein [unclassified Streptococcus]EIF40250.1 bacteriocin secretion accessory protein [Streptococcus sp. SK140]OFN96945.1 competence protein ComB [Streptococcus sp. HMSC074B11]
MQSEFLESAEFYNRRYHNFSSYVIFPSFILFLFLIVFSIFAQKEISLTAGATVEPARIIATIQSSSNSKIVANHLAENKFVKQGDLLVQYQEGAEAVQAENYASQLEMLKDQKVQLEYLKASLQAGSDQFPEADKFGYQHSFLDYLNQVASLRSQVEQQNASISSQNAAASGSQAELGNLIGETQSKIKEYQQAKSAIQGDGHLESDHPAYAIYQSTKEQGSETKQQALSQLDAQITQLESTLAGYRVQYAGSGAQQAYASGLGSQLESLKSQQLAKVGQELTLLDQKILEAESGKKIQGNLLEKEKITATEDGVLHLNPEHSRSTIIPEGTILAHLFPQLARERKAKLTAYISSKEVAGLKPGNEVRFTTVTDANKQLVLTSKITNIDTSATQTEKGNFFKLEAETDLNAEQAEKLRYGLEGRLTMITGRKSFLRYYLDRFLKQE